MKKIVLEFEIKDSFDETDAIQAITAGKYVALLHDVAEMLRKYRKYGVPEELSAQEMADKIEQDFFDLIKSSDIQDL